MSAILPIVIEVILDDKNQKPMREWAIIIIISEDTDPILYLNDTSIIV